MYYDRMQRQLLRQILEKHLFGRGQMRVSDCVFCDSFPCQDVNHEVHCIPGIDLKPEAITMMMISETPPKEARDDFYAGSEALFAQTTLMAFKDAGLNADAIEDLLARGIYLTTAIKCRKVSYGIRSATIRECSTLLEKEIALFPNVKVYMLMGDAAIKAFNTIARRNGQARVIPPGSTYKIRGGKFFFRGKPVLPSYVQSGPSFFIEKSKRRMIAEDIASALLQIKTNE
jgi:hypothetical protein